VIDSTPKVPSGSPAIRTTISSRCHRSLGRGRCRSQPPRDHRSEFEAADGHHRRRPRIACRRLTLITRLGQHVGLPPAEPFLEPTATRLVPWRPPPIGSHGRGRSSRRPGCDRPGGSAALRRGYSDRRPGQSRPMHWHGRRNRSTQAGVSTYDVFPSRRLMTTRGATSKPRCS
jgi:hypothetical protein